ncbi:MAG: hypothetical protein AAF721_36905 [Myxococcota bacterium]
MTTPPTYSGFLGGWELIVDSCRYEQGAPPRSGSYRIEAVTGGDLTFTADWIDDAGNAETVTFRGPPDGSRVPLPGGELADALAIDAVSPRELNTMAYKNGKELMIVQRQLDTTGAAMRVTQLVRLPDGTSPSNVSVYRRRDDA